MTDSHQSPQDGLPWEAYTLYSVVYAKNRSLGASERESEVLARSEVKKRYRKFGKAWVKKEMSIPAYIAGAPLVRENLAGGVSRKPKKKIL